MEQTASPAVEFSFQRFFLRSLLWNLLFSITFAAVIFYCYSGYVNTTALHNTFVLNIIILPVVWTHTVLLFIFMIRRFIKKNNLAAMCFLGQFLFSGLLSYYAYLIVALGLVYAIKGH